MVLLEQIESEEKNGDGDRDGRFGFEEEEWLCECAVVDGEKGS